MNDMRSNARDAALRAAEWVRPEIRKATAYRVPPSAGLIKLDAMENPYAVPPAVKARLMQALDRVPLNRYPDAGADSVKLALRRALAIPDAFDVLPGNGSDELIQVITCALAQPGAVMLAPDPSFVMYRANAMLHSMRFVAVPLRPDFDLDVPAMLDAIERERPALVFLAYPNNPTGNVFSAESIEAVIRATPGLVVIDEAYQAFARTSFLPRLEDFPNAVVLRTLSKLGMAAMRLGYVVGDAAWLAEFNKVRAPYNVNALTQAATDALLSDATWLEEQAAAIIGERSRLAAELQLLPGVTCFPTQTNFILVRLPSSNAVFDALLERRILVKNLHGWHALLDNMLRITVGTPEENGALLTAMQEICAR